MTVIHRSPRINAKAAGNEHARGVRGQGVLLERNCDRNKQRLVMAPRTAVFFIFSLLTWSAGVQLSQADHGADLFRYTGSVYISGDIITDKDPTAFKDIEFIGEGERRMFDRRTDEFDDIMGYLFDAYFADGFIIRVQVNSEFGNRQEAENEAVLYSTIIGQAPALLRFGIEEIWIHKGDFLPGGDSGYILIHVDRLQEDRRTGHLEELIMHEASHASFDTVHGRNSEWMEAQERDGDFISKHAHDYPESEDVAESILMYLAIKYLPGRMGNDTEEWVRRTMPNRIQYFDNQDFGGRLCPIVIGDCPEAFRDEFE
jgi:hypothetical protein